MAGTAADCPENNHRTHGQILNNTTVHFLIRTGCAFRHRREFRKTLDVKSINDKQLDSVEVTRAIGLNSSSPCAEYTTEMEPTQQPTEMGSC